MNTTNSVDKFGEKIVNSFWWLISQLSTSCLIVHDIIYLPVHDLPFPKNPGLQLQVKEPTVFVQFAFLSQSWLSSWHSFMSKKDKNQYRIIVNKDRRASLFIRRESFKSTYNANPYLGFH